MARAPRSAASTCSSTTSAAPARATSTTSTTPISPPRSIATCGPRSAARARSLPELRARGGGAIVMVDVDLGQARRAARPATTSPRRPRCRLAKAMARDLARDSIRVNAVAPGSILFPGGGWERRQKADPEGIAAFVARELPFGRFGAPRGGGRGRRLPVLAAGALGPRRHRRRRRRPERARFDACYNDPVRLTLLAVLCALAGCNFRIDPLGGGGGSGAKRRRSRHDHRRRGSGRPRPDRPPATSRTRARS